MTLTVASAAVSAAPVTGTFDERLRALEEQASGRNLVELTAGLQEIRTELRELRGMVEEQRNTLENLQRRQRDLYLDLDNRIGRLEQAAAGTADTGSAERAGQAVVTEPRAPARAGANQSTTAPSAGAGSGSAGARTAYERGFDLVRQRQYTEAIAALNQFLADYPDSGYAGNAQYWIAECYYVMGQSETALVEFNKVLEQYPESSKRSDALVKIGFLQDATGQWAQARQSLERVVAEWPGSSAAQLAQQRLDRMKQAGH
ncbi:MAG: tol-pal system protein YbgF [Pseudomonadota bacterium]|nr:tol-pal system protein YbgF [Pseudomonadota bacterium]